MRMSMRSATRPAGGTWGRFQSRLTGFSPSCLLRNPKDSYAKPTLSASPASVCSRAPGIPILQRSVVVGTSCAGKTTLARQLASVLGQAYIELDTLYWGPNWTQVAEPEFRARILAATSRDAWVLDGNYRLARELVWSRATALIWLDYAFPTVLKRALQRTIRRVATRECLFSGNREAFRSQFFSRESILWWVITTHRRRRRLYRELIESEAFPGLRAIVLRNPREAEEFLRELPKDGKFG